MARARPSPLSQLLEGLRLGDGRELLGLALSSPDSLVKFHHLIFAFIFWRLEKNGCHII